MAKRILDLLTWHPEKDISKCQVTYSHRGPKGNLKTIPATDIQGLERGFMVMIDGSMIPYHRIIKIECDNMLIWKKILKKEVPDDHIHSG
ncbi:DUF504 domain-containing protein [Methanobacterium petrolearium]|uniref:DUF504 domain-containing protein n=1 Tax=Methanobacterium petrolearium TaxID=710190 RepID=UPI0030821BF7|nr:hypothetical protein GCM10025861_02630 [Methanobacterium petrolearium]